MSGNEAKLANAASIEMYGNVMRGKGMIARAEWAYAEARKIRAAVRASIAPIEDIRAAA